MKKNNYITNFKKILAVLIVIMMVLSSCKPVGEEPDTSESVTETMTKIPPVSSETIEETEESTSIPEETETKTEEETAPTDPFAHENEKYKELTTREIKNYKYLSFLLQSTDNILCMSVPSEWTVKQVDDSHYTIFNQNNDIGEIFLGEATDQDVWTSVALTETNAQGFDMKEHIEKYGSGESLKFRYRYRAEFKDLSTVVTLTVNYRELNSSAASILLGQSTITSRSASLDLGIVPEAKEGSILVIGNSFINTSRIGSILTEMFSRNRKNVKVNAISRGMATVATYVSDSSLMTAIKRGTYDAVFVCGLYSREEISNLSTLKKACDRSNTRLIIFPAHNEESKIISTAYKRFSGVELLDWKSEIDYLIADGRDKWDFCVDDYYQHSTEVAGYVGAHMIYRAIYGEIPTARLGTNITQQTIVTVLGDYAKTGYAKGALYTLK